MLDPASEDMIIEWPTERRLCCHSAGSMTWDTAGNLYFAVGDNTNSGGDSAGMAPIDERTEPGRAVRRPAHRRATPTTCAARSTGSSRTTQRHLHDPGRQPVRAGHGEHPARDLHHGRPQPVPDLGRQEGQTTPSTGARSVRTPAPRSPTAARRPTTSSTGPPAPGNYGWPYCGGPNVAYNDWDFAANAPRGWFPCGGIDRPGQQLAPQHRPPAAAADQAARWSGSSTAAAGSGRRWTTRAAAARPTTPRSTTTTRTWSRT